MIDGRRVLAVIPARGGSKGFPGKNLARLGGTTLIGHAVAAAKNSSYIDEIVVSSDAPDILAEAVANGARPLRRPAEIATDEATTASVALHALSQIAEPPDYLVLLQPTTPLRLAVDIDRCLEACLRSGARACVSVVASHKSPYLFYWFDADGAIRPVIDATERPTRRQDARPAVMLNGAVYVAAVAEFRRDPVFAPPGTIAVEMPHERSIDIDHPDDLSAAQRVISARLGGSTPL